MMAWENGKVAESWIDALATLVSSISLSCCFAVEMEHMPRPRTVAGCAGEDHQGRWAPLHRGTRVDVQSPKGTLVNPWSLSLRRCPHRCWRLIYPNSSGAEQLHFSPCSKRINSFPWHFALLQELDPPSM